MKSFILLIYAVFILLLMLSIHFCLSMFVRLIKTIKEVNSELKKAKIQIKQAWKIETNIFTTKEKRDIRNVLIILVLVVLVVLVYVFPYLFYK